ncbi:MAG TPA: DinB family protein [Chryseolinea sp.]|nr:DinB family protein [Chryseolinea sp.]
MQIIVQELRDLIASYSPKIASISDQDFYLKPSPSRWSKIEVLGHLVDSAQNNLRRFVCGQYEAIPPHIIYDQDFWVSANNYKNARKENIIQLWALQNERICDILENMPKPNYDRQCNTGKDLPQFHTLQWLAEDYVKHLKHHLNQIIPGSFDIVYR